MAKKLSGKTTMDDVDRLFQCFKCGISPPGQPFLLSLSLSLSLCYQSHLLSSLSASAMREKKRSKKMSNPDNNTPPGTRKSLQTTSLSGKRNQIDASPSLDSLVCYHQPNLLSLFHWVIIMIVFLYHIPSLVPVM